MYRRREVEVFSLSFIDCVCCGLGAVILLLVLSSFGRRPPLEITRMATSGQVRALASELAEIRGEQDLLNRELQGRLELLERQRMRIARLDGELTDV